MTELSFASLDGTTLSGTLEHVPPATRSAVLVHGGGVTREEGGFFGRLAHGLAAEGVASLRFDLRGHGRSGGRQRDLTLASVANDIRTAIDAVREATGHDGVALIGASFSGGICALVAAEGVVPVSSLVLFNPLLDYKERFVDQKPYWRADRLAATEVAALDATGALPHSPTFQLGRALLNEVFHVRARDALGRLRTPTLIVHGTADTFIPIESSRAAARAIADCTLLEVEGAQHGIAVHDDPTYAQPRTQEWQAQAIRDVVGWVTAPTTAPRR